MATQRLSIDLSTVQRAVAEADPRYVGMLEWKQEGDIVKAKPKFYLSEMAFKAILKAFKQLGGHYASYHGQAWFEAKVEASIKILEPIEKGLVSVKCIASYPSRLEYMLYSSVEKNEYPKLFVKRVLNERLNCVEIEVVFMGQYHLEKLAYSKKPKAEWVSFGSVVLSPQQARQLGEILLKQANNVAGVGANV
jgi:hypothetical protein